MDDSRLLENKARTLC